MGFSNSILGGVARLIRSAIQSPNFVHGSTGWSINKDGSAEFHSITLPPGATGATVFVQGTTPTAHNVNDLWVDTANANSIFSWNGSAWVQYQFGAGAIQALAIVAGLIDASALDGQTINGATINGGTVNAANMMISAGTGGLFIYASPGTTVLTFTSSATWKAPAGVTSVKAECWGGGGGGGGASNSGASGGGAGGNSTFAGNSVTATAHGGSGASTGTPNGGGGSGGTGSTNSTHHSGGAGANGSSSASGGSGGSGGSASAGNAASGSTGGTAVASGGPGANGTSSASTPGSAPATGPGGGGSGAFLPGSPGAQGFGGGGGGGEYAAEPALAVTAGNTYTVTVGAAGTAGTGTFAGGAGSTGRVRLTYTSSSPVLLASFCGAATTDPVNGASVPEGLYLNNQAAPAAPSAGASAYAAGGQLKYVSSDTSAYNTGRRTAFSTSTQTITSTTAATIFSAAVAAGTYRVHGQLVILDLATAANQVIGFSGPATSTVGISWLLYSGASNTFIYQSGTYTSLTTASVPAAGFSPTVFTFDGVVTFTGSGTFSLTGAQSVAGDQWEIFAGAFMDLMPVS